MMPEATNTERHDMEGAKYFHPWPEWMKRTPPGWARKFIPWPFLRWLSGHAPICWAEVAMWKMYGSSDSWWPTRLCFASQPRYDYCGKFQASQEDDLVGPDTLIYFK